jgi:hypothetical protein
MAYWSGDGAVDDRAHARDWNTPAAIPSLVPAFPGQDREASHHRPEPSRFSRCPEIDCVRHLIPPRLAEIAELRAAEADVGADLVLITWGVISEGANTGMLPLSDRGGIKFVVAPRLVDSRRITHSYRRYLASLQGRTDDMPLLGIVPQSR